MWCMMRLRLERYGMVDEVSFPALLMKRVLM